MYVCVNFCGFRVETYLMTHSLDRTPPGLQWHTHTPTVRHISAVTFLSVQAEANVSCMTTSFCVDWGDVMTPHPHTAIHIHALLTGISQMFVSQLTNEQWLCMSELHCALGQGRDVTVVNSGEGEITNIRAQLEVMSENAHLTVSQFHLTHKIRKCTKWL